MSVVTRPETSFDGASHTYGIEGWADEDVVGISSAAKIGQALEAFDIGSRWGFRLGYEGALDVLVVDDGRDIGEMTHAELRERLTAEGLTPWSKRDKAAERGNWVHDVLEHLAQDNIVPLMTRFEGEVLGHVKSVLGWYVQYRPSFVATEVQVASTTYGFAGRYDMRCRIKARKLVHLFDGHETPMAERVRLMCTNDLDVLCLVDLKTSKGIFPTTHFPQLALYELAGVEMGFPVTDCQLVLNSKPDGSPAVLGASWVEPRDVVVFVEAYRTIKRITAADPEEKLKAMRREDILLELADGPAYARELVARVPSLQALDSRAVGRILGGMRKRGLVVQDERKRWLKKP